MNVYPKIWMNFYKDHIDKEDENQMDSTTKSDIELPPRNLSQRWRRYGHDAKRRVFERFSKWCPKGTATSNLFIYLKTDQTFPEFVLKSVIGFFGGIVLTYLCFVFFVFQLSISLIHATIMSSIIGVLLTFGLAFSYRIRCLVFLLVPQLFSRVGRYTLTCYALVLILTGPATNTLKNSEVLTESMACTQEQIKMDVKQIADSEKKPFSSMRDVIKVMIKRLDEISYKVDIILAKINKLFLSIVDVLQSSYIWLYTVIDKCNERFGTPYDHCIKILTNDATRRDVKTMQRILHNNSFVRTVCSAVNFNSKVCNAPDYLEESIAATIKRKLRTFTTRVKAMFLIKVHMHHCYTFTSNSSRSPSQVTAGIVTEIRIRADPLLTWLSWSSCITSLFLLLIIFRAKYYQHMFETRSRFDNRYITKELRHLDLQRSQEGRETVLPLNRRERAKYVTTNSLRLVASEKVHLTRSMVFMTITTFKLLIHMTADYSLYWVLTTIRYHGKRQTQLPPGPMDAGLLITGTGLIADLIRAIYKVLLTPILEGHSQMSCLPNPYPPDLKRYAQIGILIFLLWFFALFEPYGLRLRHLIMGHYRPERAKARAAWLYNHILRSRGSFMKFARRKLHKEFKYLPQESLTFRYWLRTRILCRWLRCILGIAPVEPQCLLCYAKEVENVPNSELIRCETQNCPGTYCNGCFTDIGRLCTICLSPVDYGDFSDISLEKGSSEDSDDSSRSASDKTNLLPKRKSFMKSRHSCDSYEQDDFIGSINQSEPRRSKFYSSYQSNNNNSEAPLCYSFNEELAKNICNKYLAAETLDFNNLAVPKHNLTVGYVYHNYFCDNLTNISNGMFKQYDEEAKDYSPGPHQRRTVPYGSMEKTLDTQQSKTFKPNYNLTELLKKPIIPKGKPVAGKQYPNTILTNYSTVKFLSEMEGMKKNPQKKKELRSKILTAQRRYSQNMHDKRETKKILRNEMKLKWRNTLCHIRSSITEIGNRKIKLNSYDIKKSSSTISISKILVGTKIKYRRKGKYSKSNDLQKDKHCANNASNINLEQSNKPKLRNNFPFKSSHKGTNNDNNFNICDESKYIPKDNSKNQRSKNCLSIRKIRKLISNITVIRYTLKRICYSQKKPKANSLSFLKCKHNYKRRKKYRDMAKEKAQRRKEINSTDRTLNIRNDIEMTRKYRIYSFLTEGDWIKGRPKEFSESKQENRAKNSNNVENYCAGLKSYIQGITKNIPKTNVPCTCDGNKFCESVNIEKEDWSEKSIYHSHLPVLSKSDSEEKIEKVTYGHLKMSSSVKSFTLNNVKLYIAKKFLHVRFEKPITVLRTLLSTITLAKDKVSTPEFVPGHKKNAVDKDVTASPIVKPCSCQCEIIKETIPHNEPYYLPNSQKLIKEVWDDKQTQTENKCCSCATQYVMEDAGKSNCDSFIHDLFKEYDKRNYDEKQKDIKCFTSDSTRTDTTLCSCVTIDFADEEPIIVKNKRTAKKIKVVTKSNQSTATDRTSLRNASTVTSDWWSPIPEKKEMDWKRGNYFFKKKRDSKPASFLNKRLVTFKSRTQIIPNEGSYILSPSRYLLESQKYYNELFSPRFYAPHLFPVNRTSRSQNATHVFTNTMNRNQKPKRLTQRRSSRIKISPRRLDTRSDETFSIIH